MLKTESASPARLHLTGVARKSSGVGRAEHLSETGPCARYPPLAKNQGQCAGRDELWGHLVEMAAEKGAAEAALEARQEHSELLDALVEMATKGAALEAKLEAQAEHQRIMDRVIQLGAENAQLKARVELAEIKAAMLKETLPVAVEKELLARRVAELEERLATHEEHKATATIKTAKKGTGKKAR